MSEYVTVYPEKDNEKFVAEALLALADNPNDVQVDSRRRQDILGGVGFRVPAEVFKRFEATMKTPAAKSEQSPDVVADVDKSEPVRPVKRVGRPKKAEVTE